MDVDLDPRVERSRRVILEAALDVLGETGFHWTPVGPPYIGYAPLADVVYLRVDPSGALLPRYFLRADCVARIDHAKHRFLRRSGFQLNYRPLQAGARTELYDLTQDPDLQHDLAGERPEVVADLKPRLLAWALQHTELAVRDGELSTRDPRDRERCAP